ncbi:hypothetical protein G647_00271 [Cladophialophora carrionii CBS 160.54]|uniref:Uncharacterized protein n=1 Tax=Cladophialophora carrionii CBS 160.54 TaxID=1279043 RepID=V9DPD6_9EURO|nr:uncharacterized protein G647_00271 [Cladophialophora carrionii CBS 160.54]ETI27822.1 hypothetical protein G647_00271 [Cladophialophora carrionii CBS 160.54]
MASALAVATPPRQQPLLLDHVLETSPTASQKNSPQRSRRHTSLPNQLPNEDGENAITSASKHCGLSPRRVQSLPRAWERRPAVPYAARNDAQKIWKRVPLGVVGATDGQKWRKETSKLNSRPVKRLRVTHLGEDEDKENVDYVGSKWDDDGLSTPSPRRKVLECGEPPARAVEEDQSMQISCNSDEHQDQDGNLDKTDHGTASPELGTCEASGTLGEEPSVEGEATASPVVLDMILPPVEDANDDSCTAAVTRSSPTSELTVAMATSSGLPNENLTAPILPSNDDEHDLTTSAHRTLAAVEPSLEDENAAYLWGFLSRTRAQKEAREQNEQNEQNPPGLPDEAVSAGHEVVEVSKSLQIEKGAATTPEPVDVPVTLPAANEPNIILSPRRSSRLTTRLPRPQNPVSTPTATISLKRVKGPELVANNHENQSIAVATRQNTKCNKFGAISVKIRLIQLAAEAKVRESSGVASAGCDPLIPESTAAKTKQKKVVWAETLATYQDGSDPLKESALTDEVVEAEEGPRQEGGTEGSAGELRPNTSPGGEGLEGNVTEQSIQDLFQMLRERNKNRGGMKKVRRLRRLNGGSVNGTPAPKRFTNTQLPVPVGSKPATITASQDAEKTTFLDINTAKLEANALQGAKTEGGVQTRTRSRNPKNV